jgi:plasmid stability protein
MRNARGILRDAAVAGEARNSFDVAAMRRAQSQPLGFENGKVTLIGTLREDLGR